jgi:hypothetical protein
VTTAGIQPVPESGTGPQKIKISHQNSQLIHRKSSIPFLFKSAKQRKPPKPRQQTKTQRKPNQKSLHFGQYPFGASTAKTWICIHTDRTLPESQP